MDHAARAKKALEGLIYSPRSGAGSADGVTNGDTSPAGAPADAALFSLLLEFQDAADEGAPKARPWERADLVRRLRSFRPATWFCKPAPAGPIECARRGWLNAGQDLLSCEFCKAKLALSLPVTMSREDTEKATKTFVEQLASQHAGDCPWRTATCAPELAAFPALPAEKVHMEFAARCAALAALDRIPPIAPAALAAIAASHGPQMETLLAEGPQQPQPWAAVWSDHPVQQSLDPEPDAPAAPPPRASAAGAVSSEPRQPNGTNSTPAQLGMGMLDGQVHGTRPAEVSQDAAAAGSQEFARRQRLLALLGWHAVPVPFGAVPAAGSRGDATPAEPDGSPAALQAPQARLPAGQAVILCRMCGAKHGLWSFLGAGGPDLSAARRPRPPASSLANGTPGSRGRAHPNPAQGSAAMLASAPASMQAGRGSGATPVAWRGFGSPQQVAVGDGKGSNGVRRGTQLLATTIAGGQLGGLTPRAGMKGGPFGSGGTPSGGAAGAGPTPAPFGSSSRDAPLFGTPASAGRASRQSGPSPLAACIAGGALSSAAKPTMVPDASAGATGTDQQQQSAGAASSTPPNTGSSTPVANGSAHPAVGEAPAAQDAIQQQSASPFGSGAAAAPVFGIAAMRSASFGTPRNGAAATPKRRREEAEGAPSEDVTLPKRPKTSRGLPSLASEADPAPGTAGTAGANHGMAQQPNGASAAQQPAQQPVASPASAAGSPAAHEPATAATAAATAAAPATAAAAAPAAQPTPLNPLKLHRPFCPWVQWHEAGGVRRCGWSWCLDALVPKAIDASTAGGPADAEGQPRDRASLVMSLLKQVGVRR